MQDHTADAATQPLSLLLRSSTRPTHQAVDELVLSLGSFTDLAGYKAFLRANAGFLQLAAPAFHHPDLTAAIPGLATQDRSLAALADLADFGLSLQPTPTAALPDLADRATATGWLYVAAGSALGGAVLARMAEKLGLGATYGARHLVPGDAPAANWRAVRQALDSWPATASETARASAAAQAAFASFPPLLHAAFAGR